MNILVQKYGGTSVGSIERIMNVAKRIIEYKNQGYAMVVTVSAMAGETDRLINLAKQITPQPDGRELDMMVSTGEQVSIALLAIALHSMGYKAISMNAYQAGIYTDSVYTKAKIGKINTERIIKELENDNIVIVAGFQGIDDNYNITTLGRGGSDTTAVALAAALKAVKCEIYTDVDGVYTADPRIVKEAKKLDEITYDEMLELASLGAKVLHSRSVEFAKKYDVVLEVKNSFNNNSGTIIVKESKKMEKFVVSGITCKKDEAKVNIINLPDRPGIAARIFSELSNNNINVNMIAQSSLDDNSGINNISFTVSREDLPKVVKIMENLKKELGAKDVITSNNIAIVSVVGIGMKTNPGVAARMFSILGNEKINIEMISTSEIKISVVIKEEFANKAVQLLHKEFELDKV
ncbi:MAG TPA: aspartate kinase [Spirochaetota bacterium]|nr:aspartate kinase [Spirochaetota bacterium]HOM39021.1 aspartate kinase [Spirochaetota bacterium]HPQ49926.1 aspartate kinase [Spirochaetota bacterium]